MDGREQWRELRVCKPCLLLLIFLECGDAVLSFSKRIASIIDF